MWHVGFKVEICARTCDESNTNSNVFVFAIFRFKRILES